MHRINQPKPLLDDLRNRRTDHLGQYRRVANGCAVLVDSSIKMAIFGNCSTLYGKLTGQLNLTDEADQ